jgi:O-succinylhomoserine sulfhydrylase
MRAQQRNALELAQWLEQHPAVARVYYPGCPRTRSTTLAMRQQSGLGGACCPSTSRAPAAEQARAARSTCSTARMLSHHHQPGRHQDHHHPPGQHLARPPDRSAAPGRRHRQGLIRLAVGLEHLDDIKADLLRGLDTL